MYREEERFIVQGLVLKPEGGELIIITTQEGYAEQK